MVREQAREHDADSPDHETPLPGSESGKGLGWGEGEATCREGQGLGFGLGYCGLPERKGQAHNPGPDEALDDIDHGPGVARGACRGAAPAVTLEPTQRHHTAAATYPPRRRRHL